MSFQMAKDEIRIEMLEVYAYHGVYPEETQNGQIFQVNAVLYTDIHSAGMKDELELSTNYGEVCLFIDEWMKQHTCKLLEAVAEGLGKAILREFKLVRELDLEIRKPNAPIPLPFGCVSVKIRRGWHKTYLSVGSNMGDKEGYIKEAINRLEALDEIRIKKVSELITTKPYGGVEQDDFVNGAIELETLYTPQELLDALHTIENAADRKRTIHWGPRTLDLDILFYDDLIFESESLVIPHPDMKNREFVLAPMCEIAGSFVHPIFQKTMRQLSEELKNFS